MLDEDHKIFSFSQISLGTDLVQPSHETFNVFEAPWLHVLQLIIELIQLWRRLVLPLPHSVHLIHLIIEVHDKGHNLVRIFPDSARLSEIGTSNVFHQGS